MVGRSIAHSKQLFQVSLDFADSNRYSNNCSSDLFQSSAKETIKANGILPSSLGHWILRVFSSNSLITHGIL
jgi:hypothetical protein